MLNPPKHRCRCHTKRRTGKPPIEPFFWYDNDTCFKAVLTWLSSSAFIDIVILGFTMHVFNENRPCLFLSLWYIPKPVNPPLLSRNTQKLSLWSMSLLWKKKCFLGTSQAKLMSDVIPWYHCTPPSLQILTFYSRCPALLCWCPSRCLLIYDNDRDLDTFFAEHHIINPC